MQIGLASLPVCPVIRHYQMSCLCYENRPPSLDPPSLPHRHFHGIVVRAGALVDCVKGGSRPRSPLSAKVSTESHQSSPAAPAPAVPAMA